MKPRGSPAGLTSGDTKTPRASSCRRLERSCTSRIMQRRSAFSLSRQSPLIWVTILLLGGGSLVFAIGGVMVWEQWSYRTHGQVAAGTVVSKAHTVRGRSRDYYVRYRFTREDGHVVEDESRVSEQRWQQLAQGQPVRIEYLTA